MRIKTVVDEFGLSPRPHAKIMREVMRETGNRHATQRIKRHFQRNKWTTPGGPYGYAKRTGRTLNRKRKLGVDPFRPNYQTGKLYAAILASSQLTATQYKWTWKGRNNYPLKADRRRELQAISRDEITEDTTLMGRLYVQKARALSKTRIRRRKVG